MPSWGGGADAGQGREKYILDVVHQVNIGRRVGVPGLVKVVARGDVVAEIDQARGVKVSDNQIQVVDQLDAGDRVAGRVGPNQGDAQGLAGGIRGQGDFVGAALARRQRVGRILIHHHHRIGGVIEVGQRTRQRRGQTDQAPPLGIHRRGDVEIIEVADGAGPVDQQGLHEGGTVGASHSLEEILHEGQGARDIRRGHAGARFVAIIPPERVVHPLQHLEIVPQIVGDQQVGYHIERDRLRERVGDAEPPRGTDRVEGQVRRQRDLVRAHNVIPPGALVGAPACLT